MVYWQHQILTQMSLPSIIAIVAFILLALVAAIPLFERYKEYSNWKKLFITGSVVLLFLIGVLDVYLRTTDNTLDRIAAGIEKLLHPKNSNSVKIKADTIYKSSHFKPTIKFAHIRISSPTLDKTNRADSLIANCKTINDGNSPAFNIQFNTLMVICYKNALLIPEKRGVMRYDQSVMLYPGIPEAKSAHSMLTIGKQLPNDSIFVCIKMDFSDSSKIRKSVNHIYRVNLDGLTMDEVQLEPTERIVDFLKSHKYWEPPYKQ